MHETSRERQTKREKVKGNQREQEREIWRERNMERI